jgi:hypothetical protein
MTHLADAIGLLTENVRAKYCFLGSAVRGINSISYKHEIGGSCTFLRILAGVVAHGAIIHVMV